MIVLDAHAHLMAALVNNPQTLNVKNTRLKKSNHGRNINVGLEGIRLCLIYLFPVNFIDGVVVAVLDIFHNFNNKNVFCRMH